MKLRILAAAAALSITAWASSGASKSSACADAEQEVQTARAALSKAIRECDTKSAAYQACVENKGAAGCRAEQQAMRSAQKKKKDAKAAYRYAVARKRQACGG